MRWMVWMAAVCAAAMAAAEPKAVVMVGDSITLGMRPWVAQELDGEAVVYGLPENGRYTGYALERWEDWKATLVEIPAPGKVGGKSAPAVVDVVVLGHGLWDIARVMEGGGYRTPIEVYESNVRALIGRGLGVNGPGGPGAAVVVSTITPVPVGFDVRTVDGDARRYNEVLARVVGEFRGRGERVLLCDLYGAAVPNLGEWQKPGDIHFWSWGYRGLGERVALAARWAWTQEAWGAVGMPMGWVGVWLVGCFVVLGVERLSQRRRGAERVGGGGGVRR